jgi:hypothetical protein
VAAFIPSLFTRKVGPDWTGDDIVSELEPLEGKSLLFGLLTVQKTISVIALVHLLLIFVLLHFMTIFVNSPHLKISVIHSLLFTRAKMTIVNGLLVIQR